MESRGKKNAENSKKMQENSIDTVIFACAWMTLPQVSSAKNRSAGARPNGWNRPRRVESMSAESANP
jgi:hypothetical protein